MRLVLNRFIIGIIAVGLFSATFHGLGLFKVAPWRIVYSDTLGFYEIISQPGLPYLDKNIEYPILTGFFMQLAATLGQTRAGYFILNSLFLIIITALATYFLYKIAPEQNRKRLWQFWIFAPSMLFFSVYNWDILAIFSTILAFYFTQKNRDYWAAFFLALGFSAKFFPILFLLPLLLKNPSDILKNIKIAGLFIIAAMAVNLPFALLNFTGWSYFYTLNNLRNSNPDSVWTIVRFFFRNLNVTTINLSSFLLFSSSYLFILWKYRKSDTIKLCFIATLLFLIFNKVFSPQYLLWLLPFYVLVLPGSRSAADKNLRSSRTFTAWFYILEFSNLAAFFIILPWFLIDKNIIYFYYSIPFVLLRHLALIILTILVIKKLKIGYN